MQFTQDSALQQLASMGMDDMPVTPLVRTAPNIPADWFRLYRTLAHDFMMSLSDSVEELAFLNLSQDEFIGLLMGQRMPENLSLRFRTPLMWGGRLELSNLFLCRTFPHSNNLDKFLIMQSDAQQIWLPAPVKKIYIPSSTGGGGPGGNATEDRLSQLAAQMAASRDM